MEGTKNLISGIVSTIKNTAHHIGKFYRPCAIHCECIYDDVVWKRIKEFIKKRNGIKFFCLVPTNFDFVKGSLGTSTSKGEYAEILKERYKYLRRCGHVIELHVHTSLLSHKWDYKKTKKLIGDSYNWMVENGFRPTEFVPGWWLYDKNTKKITADLGLKLVKRSDYYVIHDYELE